MTAGVTDSQDPHRGRLTYIPGLPIALAIPHPEVLPGPS